MSNVAPHPVTHVVARLLAEHLTGILVLTWESSGRQRRVRIHDGGVVDASDLTDIKAALRSAQAHFDEVPIPGVRGHRRPLELLLAEHTEWLASQPLGDSADTAVPELEEFDADDTMAADPRDAYSAHPVSDPAAISVTTEVVTNDADASDADANDADANDAVDANDADANDAADASDADANDADDANSPEEQVTAELMPQPVPTAAPSVEGLFEDLSAETLPRLPGEDEPVISYDRGPDPFASDDLVSDPSIDPFTDPEEVFLDEGGMFTMRPRTWSAPERTPPRQRPPGTGGELPPPSTAESVELLDDDEDEEDESEELVLVDVEPPQAPPVINPGPIDPPVDLAATMPAIPDTMFEPEAQVAVPAGPSRTVADVQPLPSLSHAPAAVDDGSGVPKPGPPPDPGPGGELTRNIVLDLVTRADAEASAGRLSEAEDTLTRAFQVHDMRVVRLRLAEVMVRRAHGPRDDRLTRAELILAALPDDGRNPEATEIRLRIAAARHSR